MQEQREKHREKRRRGRRERLLSGRGELKRTPRTGPSSRRSKRRSGRRRPRLNAGCRSRERRTGRRPEATGEVETVPSQAAGADPAEMMGQDAMMVLGAMMDRDVTTDRGGMELRGLDLVAPLGDPVAAAGETGSRERMMSGDQGAALEEEGLLPGVDLRQDVDPLPARTGEMLDPGGVEEDLLPGEMIEEQEEAALREEAAAAVTLETVTCVVVVDLLLAAMTVEALIVVIVMAEMAAAAPGEEEVAIVMVEIAKCVVEALLLAVMIVTCFVMIGTCVVDLLGMMIVATEDLLVTTDPMTGVVDLPVMTVTCVVDPLVMTDLVDPLVSRDQLEIKMMAGPLSRPSVNSQLCSRFIARVRVF